MDKRKYLSLRKVNNAATLKQSKIPNYIAYKDLARKINNIDIGTTLTLVLSETLTVWSLIQV